ncbi:hypothetical protein NM688_g1983 [Phlebia brevispora]|uniref:Uncharacterized protein n=1 Tax=Phlebia brevispora TaxID=194682 RepID=A0ACC1TA56_9APHY|nr:hypothetical protein NM688_g1983 [Phlebia brevispora]
MVASWKRSLCDLCILLRELPPALCLQPFGIGGSIYQIEVQLRFRVWVTTYTWRTLPSDARPIATCDYCPSPGEDTKAFQESIILHLQHYQETPYAGRPGRGAGTTDVGTMLSRPFRRIWQAVYLKCSLCRYLGRQRHNGTRRRRRSARYAPRSRPDCPGCIAGRHCFGTVTGSVVVARKMNSAPSHAPSPSRQSMQARLELDKGRWRANRWLGQHPHVWDEDGMQVQLRGRVHPDGIPPHVHRRKLSAGSARKPWLRLTVLRQTAWGMAMAICAEPSSLPFFLCVLFSHRRSGSERVAECSAGGSVGILMSQKVVICGAGFLGSSIAKVLLQTTTKYPQRRVQLVSRNPKTAHKAIAASLASPDEGRRLEHPIEGDITKPDTLTPAFEDADVVINLVGIMHGKPSDFAQVQWKGAQNVAKAAERVGAKVIHVSAIGANASSNVPYARTKWFGEQAVFESSPSATVRVLLNVCHAMTKPFEPPQTEKSPKQEALKASVPTADAGLTNDTLPAVFTYRQIMELVLRYTGRRRPIISLPYAVGTLQGLLLEQLPPNLFTLTRAQIEQLKEDNIVNPLPPPNHCSFEELVKEYGPSSKLTSVHDVLPSYLPVLRVLRPHESFRPNGLASSVEALSARPAARFGMTVRREAQVDRPSRQFEFTVSQFRSHALCAPQVDRDTPCSVINDVRDVDEKPDHEANAIALADNNEPGNEPTTSLANPQVDKPYSIYTKREKWLIVIMASIAGLFSPLTANIYFPAIPTLSTAFHKSIELINLTVTMYMVLQGISPMFWGLARVPTRDYWLLMVLRCLQAAGSASTIALGAGVIADVATRAERGSFFGFYSLGPMVGPCVGPVIGGGLADKLGWRAIFWFLCIGSALCFVAMLLFLPETLRSLVGDGSIKPHPFWRPLVPVIGRGHTGMNDHDKPPKQLFVNPLRLFLRPDVSLLLLFNAVLYAVFYGVTASISSLFSDIYPFLSETAIGLCFLAIGGGMLFGSWFTGLVLDREYKQIKVTMERRCKEDPEYKMNIEDVTKDENFPIEYARFRTMPAYFIVYVAACIGYGWCLDAKVNIAGPLILNIVIGYAIVSIMNTTQTLIVDLVPSQGSSITACNNLVRCSFGAVCVSVINLIINAIGVGWTYVLLAGLCVLVGPIMFIIIRMGPKWRAKERERQAAARRKEEEKYPQ